MRCAVPGLQRSQTLRHLCRQRRCLHLGLEQVPPAGYRQCEREGVRAMQGHSAWGHSQGRKLRMVAHSLPCGQMTQASL